MHTLALPNRARMYVAASMHAMAVRARCPSTRGGWRVMAAARMSTAPALPPHSNPPPPPGKELMWVDRLNHSIEHYPAETVASFIACDIGSIALAYGALSLALPAWGVTIPADFAVAFVTGRLLRRVRLPLDVGVAALLARLYPPLTRVRVVSLLRARLGGLGGGGAVSKMVNSVANAMDRYGLAFMVSQRVFVGLTSVFTLYAAISHGIDVQGWLQHHLGLELGSAGNVAGTWAAAACTAAFFFPAVVVGAGRLAPVLHRVRLRLTGRAHSTPTAGGQ